MSNPLDLDSSSSSDSDSPSKPNNPQILAGLDSDTDDSDDENQNVTNQISAAEMEETANMEINEEVEEEEIERNNKKSSKILSSSDGSSSDSDDEPVRKKKKLSEKNDELKSSDSSSDSDSEVESLSNLRITKKKTKKLKRPMFEDHTDTEDDEMADETTVEKPKSQKNKGKSKAQVAEEIVSSDKNSSSSSSSSDDSSSSDSDSSDDEDDNEELYQALPASDPDSEEESETENNNTTVADPFAQPLETKETTKFDEEGDDSDIGRPEDMENGSMANANDSDHERGGEKSDFAWAMKKEKKKRQKRMRRRKGDTSFSTEIDDLINDLMKRMANASNADKEASHQGIPAMQKLKLLPTVVAAFQVKENQDQFIDNGVMTAIADWLSPLPSGALPNLKIREVLLKFLTEFPACSTETLKASGVGKAVNRLRHHPKELKDNKAVCQKLTKRWCKQIFQINDLGGFSKEDRQMRDAEQLRIHGHSRKSKAQEKKEALLQKQLALKINDPGFVNRARVPIPDNKDYLIRPKPKIDISEIDMSSFAKKRKILSGNAELMDKTKKRIAELDRKKNLGKGVGKKSNSMLKF